MYGKIVNNQARCALAEINVKLGRTYLFDDYFLVSYHSLMRLPTGNHQDPEYLFFPVVGNNGHVGIGAGVDFQLLLNRDVSQFAACFFLSLESTFFIKNNQTRTFDLLGRPWSRYLLLTNIDGPRGNTTPGVNVLTRDVKVHLYNTVDFVMGWRFKTDRYELEFGYSIWGHGDEQLYLRCPFKDVWGIAGCVTDCATDEFIPGPLTPVTASGSTIEFRAPNDEIFIPILESDLDLNSGAAQAAFNNQFHFSAGMIHKGKRMDGCFGVGIFFDFPHRNTSLPMVGGWAKVGSSF
jgi:hypothetical protein